MRTLRILQRREFSVLGSIEIIHLRRRAAIGVKRFAQPRFLGLTDERIEMRTGENRPGDGMIHQLELHGPFRAALLWLAERINALVQPSIRIS